MIKTLSGISLCVLLAACGGGSSYTSTPPEPTPPPVAQDVGTQVEVQLAKGEAATDIAEPASIDAVTVPTPDDTEPKAL